MKLGGAPRTPQAPLIRVAIELALDRFRGQPFGFVRLALGLA
jgi:hypothetical protein